MIMGAALAFVSLFTLLCLGLGQTSLAQVASPPVASPPSNTPAPAASPTATREGSQSITRVVGEVGGVIVTSREVRINEAIGLALAKATSVKKITAASDKGLPQLVLKVLDEWTVFLEAGEIGSQPADKTEIGRLVKVATDFWAGHSDWKKLEPSAKEIRDIVERKLTVQAIERLKIETSTVNVSDAEALQYYKKNRLRFGSMPFEDFKENIKAAIIKAQMERRNLEWRSVLRRKYRVRNFVGA